GAKGYEIPEQILYYTYEAARGFERLSLSSRAAGKVILEAPDVEELQGHLGIPHRAFTDKEPDSQSGRAIDVEFLVRKTAPRIVIVQARPYKVTWYREECPWSDSVGREHDGAGRGLDEGRRRAERVQRAALAGLGGEAVDELALG